MNMHDLIACTSRILRAQARNRFVQTGPNLCCQNHSQLQQERGLRFLRLPLNRFEEWVLKSAGQTMPRDARTMMTCRVRLLSQKVVS